MGIFHVILSPPPPGKMAKGAEEITVWCCVLKNLLSSLECCPCVNNSRAAPTRWEVVSELWFIAIQGIYIHVIEVPPCLGVCGRLIKINA